MQRISKIGVGWCAVAAMAASSASRADNPLGLYVGAGVGQSQIGNNNDYFNPYGYNGGYHDHDVAWKAIVGMRPLPFAGAELEYIDFGSAFGNSGYYYGNYDYSVSAHPKATVLYGLGYLPLPLPVLDVYGKLGVARLQTHNGFLVANTATCVNNGNGGCLGTEAQIDETSTKFAYGVGVQAKFQDFAFRGEYEGIDSQYGNPNAFTVSVTWTF